MNNRDLFKYKERSGQWMRGLPLYRPSKEALGVYLELF